MSLASGCRLSCGARDGHMPPDVLLRTIRPPARQTLVQVRATAAEPSFTKTYEQLAKALASPGGLVMAAPTALGRGLVATRAIEEGETLLSGKLVCTIPTHPSLSWWQSVAALQMCCLQTCPAVLAPSS
jgi:hypothetical protein